MLVSPPIPLAMPECCADCLFCMSAASADYSYCIFTDIIPKDVWRKWATGFGDPSRHPKCPLKESD